MDLADMDMVDTAVDTVDMVVDMVDTAVDTADMAVETVDMAVDILTSTALMLEMDMAATDTNRYDITWAKIPTSIKIICWKSYACFSVCERGRTWRQKN